jgi:glycine/D-amino acid oxidase-like deaminating enzyme
MINQNWWFTTLFWKQHQHCPPLNKAIKCDVLIVGGGFSGMSAAAEFLGQGLSVVLIEKNIVGGSSAGRSAGFLTPDSELELPQLVRRYGTDAAREIWEMPCRGIDRIVQAIKKNDIECGLLEQDSLFPGLGQSGKEAVASELECRKSVGFTDQQTYGSAITTFLKDAYNNPTVINRVIKRFKEHFPFLKDLSFIQFWPGLIDTTRDLLPIIVKPPTQPHLQLILGIVGLPWAAFAGSFAARNVLGEAGEDYKKHYPYFSNRRHFVLPIGLANVIGKPALFSLSSGWAKFYQVDKHRKPVAMTDEF